MRLNITIRSNQEEVPFDHQHLLSGVVYKWLGESEEHGNLSLYSFSQLNGAKKGRNGLVFPVGTCFSFSAFNRDLLNRLIRGIQKDPSMFYGLVVEEVEILGEPDFSEEYRFYCGSPILVKCSDAENKKHHLRFDDPNASDVMHRILCKKMDQVGYEYSDFKIYFDQMYGGAKTKLIRYKKINNRCNVCPVIIKGDDRVKRFVWNVGVGSSTGIGFGALK
ncbi:CRISPR-associated endoribonuclease Cas6 [Halosquirtibacter xylanolyticus]|uniref:CRISPR-associated endoribonuclease Cas6 n=1 Tax=Halosquirtibacter xylanolyticus TaxID=3374599 RepID=UPI003748030E|nr:CRISPR-associated endoribonuclease Cas6 [Prolixibacteraceae bacterium]